MIISPTGKGVRVDAMGNGHYGSSRDGGTRRHKGTDYLADAGQIVVAPCTMTIVRIALPYAEHPEFSGIAWKNDDAEGKMFYFQPFPNLVGETVSIGANIGIAQDLTKLYGSRMHNHIHFQIDSINPEKVELA